MDPTRALVRRHALPFPPIGAIHLGFMAVLTNPPRQICAGCDVSRGHLDPFRYWPRMQRSERFIRVTDERQLSHRTHGSRCAISRLPQAVDVSSHPRKISIAQAAQVSDDDGCHLHARCGEGHILSGVRRQEHFLAAVARRAPPTTSLLSRSRSHHDHRRRLCLTRGVCRGHHLDTS